MEDCKFLRGGEKKIYYASVFLIIFSIGVAVGSICCGKLLKGLIHATYVPISVLGMGVGLYLLYIL